MIVIFVTDTEMNGYLKIVENMGDGRD